MDLRCGPLAGALLLPLGLLAGVSTEGATPVVDSPELDAWALIAGGLLLIVGARYFRGRTEKRRPPEPG